MSPPLSKNERVYAEQIRLLYEKNTTVLIGTLGISLATIVVLWSPVGALPLLWWFALTLLITAARFFLGLRFERTESANGNISWWANAFVVGAMANALSWSIVPVFFLLPEQPLYVLFIACLYAGYISGSVASTSVHFPAFLGFALPVTVLFSARVFLENEPIYIAIGVMIWFYAAASYSFARNNHRTILDAINLKFENIDLLDEVREQRDAAEQAVIAKNHFLAATSHDLRQPLHALGLFVEAMEGELDGHGGGKTLQKIRESTDALTKQLHGMLDLSSLDAEIIENQPRHFVLSPLLLRLADEYRAQAAHKNLSFDMNETASVVFCDENILQRVLGNLLSNAVIHTDTGGVRVQVAELGAEILIHIIDTGRGIPRKEFENIFTEYHQLRNPGRDRRHGLGLGLAIVKRLCALGGFKLDLESTLNEGTTFTLHVPKGKSEQVRHDAISINFENLDGVRVVVIDDDRDVIEGTCEMLKRWGCEAVGALDIEQAMAKLTENGEVPDILISDFRLAAGRTGLDAVAHFQKHFVASIHYLVITGETMPAELQAVNQAGIQILHKPVKPGELRNALHQLLSSAPQPIG